jgi:uncharacterized MAPEG superfamily protein
MTKEDTKTTFTAFTLAVWFFTSIGAAAGDAEKGAAANMILSVIFGLSFIALMAKLRCDPDNTVFSV